MTTGSRWSRPLLEEERDAACPGLSHHPGRLFADPPVGLTLVRQDRDRYAQSRAYLGQEPGLVAPAQQQAHLRDGEQLDELQIPDEERKWDGFTWAAPRPPPAAPANTSGARRKRRQLKHRAAKEVRPVPVSPALAL